MMMMMTMLFCFKVFRPTSRIGILLCLSRSESTLGMSFVWYDADRYCCDSMLSILSTHRPPHWQNGPYVQGKAWASTVVTVQATKEFALEVPTKELKLDGLSHRGSFTSVCAIMYRMMQFSKWFFFPVLCLLLTLLPSWWRISHPSKTRSPRRPSTVSGRSTHCQCQCRWRWWIHMDEIGMIGKVLVRRDDSSNAPIP